MKSAREWIKQLKPEHRDLAFWSLEDSDGTYSNLADALFYAFAWSKTPQGYNYWNGMHYSLTAGTYHFTADESAERMATEEDYEKLNELTTKPTEDVLEEALRITGGDRMNDYGPPDQDFKRTAIMWEQILNTRIVDGELKIKPQDVASCMIALKLSRQTHQGKRDNWVDIAAYSRCASLCQEVEA